MCVIETGMILCIAFVPKEKVLSHIDSLESQAEKAEKSKEEHASVQKETKEQKEETVISDEEILKNLYSPIVSVIRPLVDIQQKVLICMIPM